MASECLHLTPVEKRAYRELCLSPEAKEVLHETTKMLYELREFYHRNDLSAQAKSSLQVLGLERNYPRVVSFIEKQEALEDDVVLILKKGIFAGYDSSTPHGACWSLEEETKFWDLVALKTPNNSVSAISLAVHYANNELKDEKDLLDDFYRAITMNFEHLYSIPERWSEQLKYSEKYKFEIVDLEFGAREPTWKLEDYKEELPFLDKIYDKDKELLSYVKNKMLEKIDRLEQSEQDS